MYLRIIEHRLEILEVIIHIKIITARKVVLIIARTMQSSSLAVVTTTIIIMLILRVQVVIRTIIPMLRRI